MGVQILCSVKLVVTYDDPDKLMHNGLDMEMPDSARFNGLKDAVKAGKISNETLNLAVRRTMRSRIKSGMLDFPKATLQTSIHQKTGKLTWKRVKKQLPSLKTQTMSFL